MIFLFLVNDSSTTSPVENVIPVIPVLTAPVTDLRLASSLVEIDFFHVISSFFSVMNYLLINHVYKNKNK